MRALLVGARGAWFVRFPTPAGPRAHTELVRRLGALVARHGRPRRVGIAGAPRLSPGGRVIDWPSRPDWLGVRLLDAVARGAGARPIYRNDGACAGLWEHARAAAPSPRRPGHPGRRAGGDRGGVRPCVPAASTLVLSVGTGLGVGYVRGHRIVDVGAGGATPAHRPVPGARARCTCGRRGCLQTLLRGQALRGASDARLRDHLTRGLAFVTPLLPAERVVLTGGVVGHLGPRRVARLSCAAVSRTPAWSGLGGAVLLASSPRGDAAAVPPAWIRRVACAVARLSRGAPPDPGMVLRA